MKKKDTIPRKFSYLFDEVIDTPKSRDITKRAIPILVRWAKHGIRNNEYNHLNRELGYAKGYSGIGLQLGYIAIVLGKLSELTGVSIPLPNALVNGKGKGMPSKGLAIVEPSFSKAKNKNEQKEVAHDLQTEAIEYPHWDWVLSVLGLKPSVIDTSSQEKEIRKGKGSGGGEGEEHKALKKYVYDHPEQFGIKKVVSKEMEHILLSGDKLDVYFELKDGSKVAVEIKPSTSPDDDILRGLFQCLKYQTILDAEDRLHGQDSLNRVFIVLGGRLSAENGKVRHLFGIEVKENVKG